MLSFFFFYNIVTDKIKLNFTVLEQKKNHATFLVWPSEKNTVLYSSF